MPNLDTRDRGGDNAYVSRVLAPLLIAACVGACHRGGDGASCETVAGAFQAMARSELDAAKVDEATRRAVSEQIPAMRDSLVAVCKDGSWSVQVRDCMAKAADHAALQLCETQLTDDQRRAIAKAARGDVGDAR